MQDSPIAMIEFVAFIGLVIWLFIWQNKSSTSTRAQSDDSQDRAESTETQAEQSVTTGSEERSGEDR